MPSINITFQEPAWPDLAERRTDIIHLGNGAPPMGLAVLDHGMASGRPSVGLRIDLPDGKVVIAELSARLLVSAAVAIQARYPRLMED